MTFAEVVSGQFKVKIYKCHKGWKIELRNSVLGTILDQLVNKTYSTEFHEDAVIHSFYT